MDGLITMDERGRMVAKDRVALQRAVADLEQADPQGEIQQLRLLGVGLLVLGRYDEAIAHLRALRSVDEVDVGGRPTGGRLEY